LIFAGRITETEIIYWQCQKLKGTYSDLLLYMYVLYTKCIHMTDMKLDYTHLIRIFDLMKFELRVMCIMTLWIFRFRSHEPNAFTAEKC
jgi:hypothetical protein